MKKEQLVDDAIWRCERMLRSGISIEEVKAQICVYAIGIEKANIINIYTMCLAIDMYLEVMKRSKKEKL